MSDRQNRNQVALTVITTLFFMWGFLTSLNDILIPHLKAVFDLNYTQSMLIQFTFFSAYFVMSLPSGKLVATVGYQRGIVIGLIVAGIGALLFYPASAIPSYGLFLTALFILASGITVLQVAANPYVAALGDPDTSSSRLNLAQAFNSLGTTIAPYLGGLIILGTVLTAAELEVMSAPDIEAYKMAKAQTVQLPYIGLGVALFLLAIVISRFDLPTIQGTEHDEAADDSEHSFLEVLKVPHLRFGVIGIFVYVGAEVSIGSFLVNYISLPEIGDMEEMAAAAYVSYYWGGAMVGRFIGSALLQKFEAGKLLGIYALVAGVLCVTTTLTAGMFAAFALVSIGFFNSIMFPNIFTLGIKGLGSMTSKASSLLIMAIVGGAVIPIAMGALADSFTLQAAFILPAFCYAYIMYYGFIGSRSGAPETA